MPRLFGLGLCLAVWLGPVPAAETADSIGVGQVVPRVTQEQVVAGRKALEGASGLDEQQLKQAAEFYDQAASWLKQLGDTQERYEHLRRLVDEAPRRIDRVADGQVAALPTQGYDKLVAGGDLRQIELALTQLDLQLQQAREAYRKHADELASLLMGDKDLSAEIASHLKVLDQIAEQLQLPRGDTPPALWQAERMMLSSRHMLRKAELDLYRLRFASNDLLATLSQAERDFSSAQIGELQKQREALAGALQRLREEQARTALQQAEQMLRETETLPRVLQGIAEENARYRQELEDLVRRGQAVNEQLQATRQELEDMRGDYERTRLRVEAVGATAAIGKMLKRRRDELPSLQNYRRASVERGAEIGRATDRQIEIDELLRRRGDTSLMVREILDTLPQQQQAEFQQQVLDLVRARREALNELQKSYGRYSGEVIALDLAKRTLVDLAGSYIGYIDEQMLWIPGPGIVPLLQPSGMISSAMWFLAPGHWLQVLQDSWSLLREKPLQLLALLALVALLLSKRARVLQRLAEVAEKTRRIRTDSFFLTIRALVYTLVLISPWPLLLLGLGGLYGSLSVAAPFTLSLAAGLSKAGAILMSILFLIQICGDNGLGDRHLRWPQGVRNALMREFGWLLPIALPLGFLVAAVTGNEPPPEAQSLGRLAFVLLMLVSSVFVYRLLNNNGELMQCLYEMTRGGNIMQLHFLWFPLMLLLPLAFAISSSLGYHTTALHIERRAEGTFWFFVGLFMLKELLLRWLFIAERRLRLEDALRRRDELRAQRAQEDEGIEEEAPLVSLDIPELDFEQLGEQNRRLVSTGFLFGAVVGVWSIWSDLLPALAFLNNTELPLLATRVVDGIPKEIPVTLGDVTVGLIMLAITVLAAKNIPGVLEIALLQRLPLDPGARYAITSLTQYTIVGIGVLTAFSTLGLQWSSVQWLVAALSVGLGFGLQEIVANFVSGIILLFERPIRIGDVVTVDNTTGVVTRIRIRATTITNYEKQELLIPNKEFITGRVINWTLSDKVNRLLITVGVAYDTDVDWAMALMLEAAQENENVLDEPKPVASFEGFGDNALTLLLRAYLGSMDNRVLTTTELHRAIHAKFKSANIEIAFPQRDVHLDASRPLDIRLHRPARAPAR